MASVSPIVAVRFTEEPVRASLGLLALASACLALSYSPEWAQSGPISVPYILVQSGLMFAGMMLLFRRNRQAEAPSMRHVTALKISRAALLFYILLWGTSLLLAKFGLLNPVLILVIGGFASIAIVLSAAACVFFRV